MSTRKKAFSIVELIIYTGVYVVLLTVLSQLFITTLQVQSESQASSSVTQDGRYILSRFAYDIRRASSIDTPASPGSQASALVLTIGGSTYTYALDAGNLFLNSEQINSYNTSVSNLNFIRLGNVGGKNNVQLSFTLTSNVVKASGSEVTNFQTTVGLR